MLRPDYESKFSPKPFEDWKKGIPVSVATELCDINRTSIYYKGRENSAEELICKRIVDQIHTDNPSLRARQMSAQLKLRGYHIGCKKAFQVAKAEIFNSDQGCQFTSHEYKQLLKDNGIKQSMDGKSR